MTLKNLLMSIVCLTLIITLVVGCDNPTPQPGTTSTSTLIPPTLTSTATTAPTITVEPTKPPPTHIIGIRLVNGVGEFYNSATGEKYIPRGNNYIRLAEQQSTSGEMMVYHSTFNVGLYDPALAEDALRRMHEDGYNVVRVFVQGNCKTGCIGDPTGGLSEAYIANVVDFMRKAKANDIFVILTTDAEPATAYYISLLDTTWSENFGGTNSSYLRGGGILVGKEFWQDLIEELINQDAPLEVIFAYELRNELFFETNAAPFSLNSGVESTANGKTYDMASEEDRQRMMDENLVIWINQIRTAILERDPTALVTVGFFWPQKPHPSRIGDPRVIDTRPAIWESNADFIDLHPYPGWDLTLPQYVDNFGMVGMEEKPIIMGEFGAARSSYTTEVEAARALHDWQVESCGYGFDGWLLWTYDTEEQTDFYNGMTGDGQINQLLAPVKRHDPCQQ